MKLISDTSLEEIWLQRISMRIGYEERYSCGICKKINEIHRCIYLISKQLNRLKLENKKYEGTYLDGLPEISVNLLKNKLHRVIYNTPKNFWNSKIISNIWNNSWMKPEYRKRFNESFINIYKLCHINENIDPKDINPFESYD